MTDAALRAALRQPFPEQVAAFRLRLGNLVPTARWDDLWQAQHDRAFMVAGAVKADLLADLGRAVDRAISDGTGLDAFRRDFRAIVGRHGWHGWTGEGSVAGEAWRTRVIYRTNLRTSYMAGRRAQLVEGNFKYWVYLHSGAEHPRLQHLVWNGIALPPDHPFWEVAFPPNGWGCGCRVRGANSEAGVRRLRGDPDKALPEGWHQIDPKTGAPQGIGKGWAYAPGASASETITLAARKIAALPADLGAHFGRSLDAVIDRHWPVWVAETQSGRRHDAGLIGTLDNGVLDALRLRDIAPLSAEVVVRPGLVRGPKARRHDATGDALSSEQWMILPQLFRNPLAVYIDEQSGNLIYVLATGDIRQPQIAVSLDYARRVNRDAIINNAVVSAYQARSVDLLARVAQGLLTLIFGGLG